MRPIIDEQKRNKNKLQDLVLVKSTPTSKSSSKVTLKKSRTPNPQAKSPKAKRKILKSFLKKRQSKKKRNKINKYDSEILEDCLYNHKSFTTSYKEENDKRYFDEGGELFRTGCQGCREMFCFEAGKGYIDPSSEDLVYICTGRNKHKCTHTFCIKCYQQKSNDSSRDDRTTRRRIRS